MKVKAIIYQSKQGTSKAYAKLFASIVKVPTFSLEEAKFNVLENSEVIYFSYIDKGKIKDYHKIKDLYDIKAAAIAHILPTTKEEVIKQNDLHARLFLLEGSFDIHKLKGLDKLLAKFVMKDVSKIEHEISKKDLEELLDFYYYA